MLRKATRSKSAPACWGTVQYQAVNWVGLALALTLTKSTSGGSASTSTASDISTPAFGGSKRIDQMNWLPSPIWCWGKLLLIASPGSPQALVMLAGTVTEV